MPNRKKYFWHIILFYGSRVVKAMEKYVYSIPSYTKTLLVQRFKDSFFVSRIIVFMGRWFESFNRSKTNLIAACLTLLINKQRESFLSYIFYCTCFP